MSLDVRRRRLRGFPDRIEDTIPEVVRCLDSRPGNGDEVLTSDYSLDENRLARLRWTRDGNELPRYFQSVTKLLLDVAVLALYVRVFRVGARREDILRPQPADHYAIYPRTQGNHKVVLSEITAQLDRAGRFRDGDRVAIGRSCCSCKRSYGAVRIQHRCPM